VPWYNAHPDFVGVDTPLDADTAVVIGAGFDFDSNKGLWGYFV
jgi:hypothetical protein